MYNVYYNDKEMKIIGEVCDGQKFVNISVVWMTRAE